jgi:hypothetical protein
MLDYAPQFEAFSRQDSGDIVLPDSPTGSTYVTLSREMGSPKQKRRTNRVSFASAVKSWDGLTMSSLVVDALITRYFVKQQECSELDVLQIVGNNCELLSQLYLDLEDLAIRIELALSNGQPCEPVLPRGGGANVKLSLPHLPYVRILIKVVKAADARLVIAAEACRAAQQMEQ